MTPRISFEHEFVEFVPADLKEGRVYVSIEYATAVHRCACGCGTKVVTPLSRTDWRLIFDGETISLEPSIGNWSFPCRSHYWITNDRVRWAAPWSRGDVEAGRASDLRSKRRYYEARPTAGAGTTATAPTESARKGLWASLRALIGRALRR
jgi:hypothetical protein